MFLKIVGEIHIPPYTQTEEELHIFPTYWENADVLMVGTNLANFHALKLYSLILGPARYLGWRRFAAGPHCEEMSSCR